MSTPAWIWEKIENVIIYLLKIRNILCKDKVVAPKLRNPGLKSEAMSIAGNWRSRSGRALRWTRPFRKLRKEHNTRGLLELTPRGHRARGGRKPTATASARDKPQDRCPQCLARDVPVHPACPHAGEFQHPSRALFDMPSTF